MRRSVFSTLCYIWCVCAALAVFVSASPPPQDTSSRVAMCFVGMVEVRGHEPFTYAVFVTDEQVLELSGPLKSQLIDRYQQQMVRICGDVAENTLFEREQLKILIAESITIF